MNLHSPFFGFYLLLKDCRPKAQTNNPLEPGRLPKTQAGLLAAASLKFAPQQPAQHNPPQERGLLGDLCCLIDCKAV